MSLFTLLTAEASEPARATLQSVGYDLVATGREWNEAKTQVTYRTGVSLGELPPGIFGVIYPRSSIYKTDLRLANSAGVIDPDYSGELLLTFDCPLSASMVISPGNANLYAIGDKIGQIVFQTYTTLDVEVPIDERLGGFGSTGKKKK